ncbi:MAG: ParB N-terminal domain-containing protein [Candidatus Ornithomonoglobus sp.]
MLSPLVVRPHKDGGYEILSGHRRATACKLAGREKVPVIVRNLDDDKVLLADTITEVENGLDLVTATKEAHTKIYQSINPAFDPEVQFSIDTRYRDIPAVDMAVYNRTRKLLDNANKVYIQKTAEYYR